MLALLLSYEGMMLGFVTLLEHQGGGMSDPRSSTHIIGGVKEEITRRWWLQIRLERGGTNGTNIERFMKGFGGAFWRQGICGKAKGSLGEGGALESALIFDFFSVRFCNLFDHLTLTGDKEPKFSLLTRLTTVVGQILLITFET